jgi:hypothetical protein
MHESLRQHRAARKKDTDGRRAERVSVPRCGKLAMEQKADGLSKSTTRTEGETEIAEETETHVSAARI